MIARAYVTTGVDTGNPAADALRDCADSVRARIEAGERRADALLTLVHASTRGDLRALVTELRDRADTAYQVPHLSFAEAGKLNAQLHRFADTIDAVADACDALAATEEIPA